MGNSGITQVQRFERARRIRDAIPRDDTDIPPGTLVTAFVVGTAVLLTGAVMPELTP